MKNAQKNSFKKQIVSLIVFSVLTASLAGCKDNDQKEKEARTDKQFIDNMNFKHSEPKKSVF